jgi:hypothetical protein
MQQDRAYRNEQRRQWIHGAWPAISSTAASGFRRRTDHLRLRPSLRSVQNSQDDYLFITNFINGEKREWRKRELSSTVDPTRTPQLRERLERAHPFHHGLCDPLSGLGAVLGDVIADPFQVIRCIRRPADAHQPRYRRSMRAATSSCSSSLPSRDAARPFSTSARNHSSWSIELTNRSSATWSAVRPVSAARRSSFASSSGGTCRFMESA